MYIFQLISTCSNICQNVPILFLKIEGIEARVNYKASLCDSSFKAREKINHISKSKQNINHPGFYNKL